MKAIVIVMAVIIAYGMYAQVNNGQDIFTMFWALVGKFLGG